MKMRKGFTLVELMVVIMIIGILAAAMLLATGSSTASAKASNIISDLRTMQSAVLLLYTDSMDEFEAGKLDFATLVPSQALKKYVDNPEKYNDKYTFDSAGGKWFVAYTLDTNDAGAEEIKTKLTGKAKSVGLLSTADITDTYAGGGEKIMMVAR